MKRIILAFFFILSTMLVAVDLDFYGNARIGVWYVQKDKDMTGTDDSRLDMEYDFYTNSRFGANVTQDRIKANVEFGFKYGDAYLRTLYGEYSFDKLSLLVGQDYTGFCDFPAQATSIYSGKDELMVGFGTFYDSRHPMVKVTLKNGPYVSLMEPKVFSPNQMIEDDAIDALIPRTNIGMKFKIENIKIHATLGINLTRYNEDYAIWEAENPEYDPADSTSMEYIIKNTDELINAYAAALTMEYIEGDFSLKGQFNFGQNVADYGIFTATMANAGWDEEKDEIANSITTGGYGQVGYKMNDKLMFVGGVGFIASENDFMKNQDTAMTLFGQVKYKIAPMICLTPEIGMFDFMEDGYDNPEGSQLYFGTKLQADLP